MKKPVFSSLVQGAATSKGIVLSDIKNWLADDYRTIESSLPQTFTTGRGSLVLYTRPDLEQTCEEKTTSRYCTIRRLINDLLLYTQARQDKDKEMSKQCLPGLSITSYIGFLKHNLFFPMLRKSPGKDLIPEELIDLGLDLNEFLKGKASHLLFADDYNHKEGRNQSAMSMSNYVNCYLESICKADQLYFHTSSTNNDIEKSVSHIIPGMKSVSSSQNDMSEAEEQDKYTIPPLVTDDDMYRENTFIRNPAGFWQPSLSLVRASEGSVEEEMNSPNETNSTQETVLKESGDMPRSRRSNSTPDLDPELFIEEIFSLSGHSDTRAKSSEFESTTTISESSCRTSTTPNQKNQRTVDWVIQQKRSPGLKVSDSDDSTSIISNSESRTLKSNNDHIDSQENVMDSCTNDDQTEMVDSKCKLTSMTVQSRSTDDVQSRVTDTYAEKALHPKKTAKLYTAELDEGHYTTRLVPSLVDTETGYSLPSLSNSLASTNRESISVDIPKPSKKEPSKKVSKSLPQPKSGLNKYRFVVGGGVPKTDKKVVSSSLSDLKLLQPIDQQHPLKTRFRLQPTPAPQSMNKKSHSKKIGKSNKKPTHKLINHMQEGIQYNEDDTTLANLTVLHSDEGVSSETTSASSDSDQKKIPTHVNQSSIFDGGRIVSVSPSYRLAVLHSPEDRSSVISVTSHTESSSHSNSSGGDNTLENKLLQTPSPTNFPTLRVFPTPNGCNILMKEGLISHGFFNLMKTNSLNKLIAEKNTTYVKQNISVIEEQRKARLIKMEKFKQELEGELEALRQEEELASQMEEEARLQIQMARATARMEREKRRMTDLTSKIETIKRRYDDSMRRFRLVSKRERKAIEHTGETCALMQWDENDAMKRKVFLAKMMKEVADYKAFAEKKAGEEEEEMMRLEKEATEEAMVPLRETTQEIQKFRVQLEENIFQQTFITDSENPVEQWTANRKRRSYGGVSTAQQLIILHRNIISRIFLTFERKLSFGRGFLLFKADSKGPLNTKLTQKIRELAKNSVKVSTQGETLEEKKQLSVVECPSKNMSNFDEDNPASEIGNIGMACGTEPISNAQKCELRRGFNHLILNQKISRPWVFSYGVAWPCNKSNDSPKSSSRKKKRKVISTGTH